MGRIPVGQTRRDVVGRSGPLGRKLATALELKVPPPALVIITGFAMWAASAAVPSLALALLWRHAVAIAIAAAGIIFGLAGVVEFRRAGTTFNPTKPGNASALVTSGVYRYSRNPMYVGVLVVLVGWAAFLANAFAFLFLPVFVAYMNRFQIAPEERALSVEIRRCVR